LKKAYGIDGIPNECHRHFPRKPLVHLTHLINLLINLINYVFEGSESGNVRGRG
jgi:hypothetical protein